MPNLATHITFANELNKSENLIDDHDKGIYLLGSTAPDIRVLTKEPREKYHFVSLNFDNIGDGINNMMKQFPVLQNTPQTNQLKSFLAGYFSHLVLDETWITKIFRPLFGQDSNFNNTLFMSFGIGIELTSSLFNSEKYLILLIKIVFTFVASLELQ